MVFDFSDEDGFISIVNADKYIGYVDADWQLDQLFKHFVDQMNNHNLIICSSNDDGGNEWKIEVLNQPSDKKEFRYFNFPIVVTSETLYFSPYNDLTMAAQFEEEVVPSKHNSHLKIKMDNGLYNVTVRQMLDLKDWKNYNPDEIHFEIIFKSTMESKAQTTDKVFWWTQ